MNDLKYAIRQLVKNPGFTAVAVLVLALGIGANTTIFTLINAVVLKPIGGRSPERLVGVYSHDSTRPGSYRGFSYPNFNDLRADREVFEDIYACTPNQVGVTEGDTTRRVFAMNVSANYFSVFATPVSLGRDFSPADEKSANPVVIVSHGWWERHGSDPGIVGRSITVNGKPNTIIGVAARGFTGTVPMFPAELFLPLLSPGTEAARLNDRAKHEYILVGRLREGLSMEAANSRLARTSAQLGSLYPAENKDQLISVARLARMAFTTNPSDERVLLRALIILLQAMSCAVLLIACLNLANLLLARGAARRKEVAIRLALGAGRSDILRQLLVEGWLLALAGGAMGLSLAVWAAGGLARSLQVIAPAPLSLDTAPDARVLTATLVFCALATLGFALGPAWKLARPDVNSDLKRSTGEDASGQGARLFAARHLLVVIQVALSLALLVAAGLIARGAIKAVKVDPGFSPERGFYLQFDASLAGHPRTRVRQLYGEVLERVRNLPGVESATMAATVPLGALSLGEGVQRAGSPLPPPPNAKTPADGQSIGANYNVVAHDYFRTLGVGLLRGREFETREFSDTGLPQVAVINAALAQKLWPGEDALGRRIQFTSQGGVGGEGVGTFLGSGQPAGRTLEVVGVVTSFKAHLNDHEPSPMVFVPFAQDYRPEMSLHVRTPQGVDPSAVMHLVREEVRRLDPSLPIVAAKTLRNHIDTNIQVWVIRTGALLFAAMGGAALFLAVVGVYAVKAYAVARRTREIGIRMALGASRSAVLGLILREGTKLTFAGLSFGLVLAAGAAKAMGGFLFEVQPFDPLIFTIAPAILALAALVACWLPARRASRVDPMVALRSE